MMELMFDKFNNCFFYLGVPGILSIFNSGRTRGIVLDCGDGVFNF